MYCDFFLKNLFYKYCYSILLCCDVDFFLFLTLDHGEKLNDTLNIQTVIIIIKTHLISNFSCFISVFSKQTNSHKNSNRKIFF